jgi:thiol-disulfide isomerase/thioredoxin
MTVTRRQLLFGLGGITLTGGGAWVATQGLSIGAETGLPMQIKTMAAPGSTKGSIRVPVTDTVTVIDLFATWCTPCKAQMDALTAVHEAYHDTDTVAFVSVTNERIGGTLSRADLRAWWRQNDGHWTVGLDPDSSLMAALGASGLPYIAIAAPDGTITWRHSGVTTTATLRANIEAARQR